MAASWGELLIGARPPAVSVSTAGIATGGVFDCPGGLMVFAVAGGFNGATVVLVALGPDNSTFLPVKDVNGNAVSLTASGQVACYLAPCQVQAQVSVAVPTGIYATLARVVS